VRRLMGRDSASAARLRVRMLGRSCIAAPLFFGSFAKKLTPTGMHRHPTSGRASGPERSCRSPTHRNAAPAGECRSGKKRPRANPNGR
jgi:hypothetical protein